MKKITLNVRWIYRPLLAVALLSLVSRAPAYAAAEEEKDDNTVVIGAQGVSLDSERPAKFELNRQVPSGFVLDLFRWSLASEDGLNFIQVESKDAVQEDQLFNVRAGVSNKLKLRIDWIRSPHRYGNSAVFIPGISSDGRFQVPDFVQQQLEDPDGNGVPFYSEPGGVEGDNALAAALTNQLLSGQNPFTVQTQREKGALAFSLTPSPELKIDVGFSREWKDGERPGGNGTYQRITDVNGDGRTDYDYFFSLRGTEVPATIDYVTTRFDTDARYSNGRFFAEAGFNYSDFNNAVPAITYDNVHWSTPTLATSGIRRGLWPFGRVSQPPSNEAWNFSFTGGGVFAGKTQLTATVSRGRLSQNDPFLPVTTNAALIGTADVNGDGVVDGSDDPTVTSTLPRASLDASVNTTIFDVRITSRPSHRVRLKALYRLYDYDSTNDPFVVPFRAEYIESRLKPDFHHADLLHVPIDFQRSRFVADAELKASDAFKVVPFFRWVRFDRDQYVDLGGGSVFTRDAGFRAVPRTNEYGLGLGVIFHPVGDFGGRLTYKYVDRDFDGTYQPGFDGENQGVRQFDIAKLQRTAVDLELNFLESRPANFSVGFRLSDDDYPDSDYGRQTGKEQGVYFNVNYFATEKLNLFAYAEWSRLEFDSHLRTKCKNCKAPAGASWKPPWEVPNFDWFVDYTDTTASLGGGGTFGPESGVYSLDFQASYLKGNIEQLTRNPAPPLDLANPGSIAQVALGVDFPDQETKLMYADVTFTRRLTERFSVGLRYWVEDFQLADFMWDPMNPYGRNYLEIDDYTRFMLLDSRYGDYTAQVVLGFLKLSF